MYTKIYFIGIGGIGMSAIARYYKRKGYCVAGYDKTPSDLTRALEDEGICVHYNDDPDQIPSSTDDTLIVYTPAIPDDFGELAYVRERGYRVVKRSRMLGEITDGQTCLAVAGTHGKTTTSTLVAHILYSHDEGCSAFLGGISKNYNTNLLVSEKDTVVVEADEFDRSFLQLYPDVAVITAMDADHLDIYGDLATYQQAFRDFASQVKGTVIKKYGIPLESSDTKAELLSYSLFDKEADFHAENIRQDGLGHYIYDLIYPGGEIAEVRVGTPGRLNAENSIAAAAICLSHGVSPSIVREGIGTFAGVKRRIDVHVNTEKISYIDDYAHHPEELSSAIASIRDIYPTRKLTAIFQPHLYTRTRDFAEEFAQALSKVDKLILLDIYPAREEPIPGVSSELIFDKVDLEEKVLINKDSLLDYLKNEPVDVLITFGAGNIDRFIEPITQLLNSRI